MTVKKNLLIILNLVLVALIVVASYFLFTTWQDRRLSDFLATKQTELAPDTFFALQEGNIGDTHIVVHFPTDEKGEKIALVEEAIQEVIKAEVGTASPSGKIKEVFFITATDSETPYSTVRQTTIKKEVYQVDLLSIDQKSKGELASFLLTEENQPFDFHSLFKNAEKTKAILSQQLKTELEAKATDPVRLAEIEAAFGQVDVATLAFTYANSQIQFELTEETFGLANLAVPVEGLYDVINGKYLSETDAKAYEEYKEKKAKEKMIALTFDDGPNPATTLQILDTLKKYDAKATFFILGQNVPGNEEILKRMVAEGHELANYTWSHPDLTTLSPEQIQQEVNQTQDVIKQATGQTPVTNRPPYGAFNQTVMNTMGLPAIHWSVDTLDWQSRNPQAILNIVQSSTYPGSIILMHDIHQPTADALPAVMEFLVSQGYTFGTITDLLGDELNPQHVYYDRNRNEPAQ
ncbi:polysaccharide deacetylase family protein [Streptococcus cameli]